MNGTVARQVVMAISMLGVGLVFVFLGREPGWQAFGAACLLALSFLVSSLATWRGSRWLGLLALAVLMLAILWDRENPKTTITGLTLAALRALSASGVQAKAASLGLPPEQTT